MVAATDVGFVRMRVSKVVALQDEDRVCEFVVLNELDGDRHLLPYHAVRLRLQLATVYLAIADPATARQLLREIDDILSHRPAIGTLVDEVGELRGVLATSGASGAISPVPLPPAELRLLPYLQTHLTADAIAERLFLSGHTERPRSRRSTGRSASDLATTRSTRQQQSACSAANRRNSRDRGTSFR